ncbi:small multi-drug export protein [archaeon]|nr:small multi-drug export protein [archaeon]
MLKEILILSGIMFLPFIEIRLAIPAGILTGLLNLPFGISLKGFGFPPLFVFFLASVMGFLLAFILFNSLHFIDKPLKKSKFGKKYLKLLAHAQNKIKPYVDKYGLFGLAFYISLPIPGSGIYMGSLGGYVIGMEKKKFYMAALMGSTFAALIVTTLVVLGKMAF